MIFDPKTCLYSGEVTPDELRHRTAAVHDALAARDAAIVQAAHERIPKPVVMEATGLSKEHLRRIERAGGAPHRAAGRPPVAKTTDSLDG
jgi:hypothetical protein